MSNPPSYSGSSSAGDDRPLPSGWLKQARTGVHATFSSLTARSTIQTTAETFGLTLGCLYSLALLAACSEYQANPPRSIWVHPLDDPEFQRQSGRTSPYPSPQGAPPTGDQTRLFGSGRPQGSYQSGAPQGYYGQGQYQQGYNQGPPQGYYGPPQGQYGPPQGYYSQGPPPQQYQYQQPPRKSGFGGGSMLPLVGGLAGGALLADAFEHHEDHQEQQAYDQGYNNGYDQGQDQQGSYDQGYDDGGGGGFDGGDMGGGF